MSGANGRQLMVFSSMYGRLATSLLTLRSFLKIILSIAHAIKAARLGLAFNSTSLETAARASSRTACWQSLVCYSAHIGSFS